MSKLAEIDAIHSNTARDLMAIYRELEGVRTAFNAAPERQQMYVVQFREDAGQMRVAVVKSVTRLPDGRIAMETTGGENIVISTGQIEAWEPLLQRDAEPLPDGWWRELVV